MALIIPEWKRRLETRDQSSKAVALDCIDKFRINRKCTAVDTFDADAVTAAQRRAFESREALKAELLALIEPYKFDDECPPFSEDELFVIGAVCCDDEDYRGRLDTFTIYAWIVATFKHYRALAVVQHLHAFDYNKRPNQVVNLGLALSSWHGPVTYSAEEGCTVSATAGRHWSIRVPADAARIFLRHVLQPRPSHFFRLLDLPAELRTNIYEMALRFPVTGFQLDSFEERWHRLKLIERDVNKISGNWLDSRSRMRRH